MATRFPTIAFIRVETQEHNCEYENNEIQLKKIRLTQTISDQNTAISIIIATVYTSSKSNVPLYYHKR